MKPRYILWIGRGYYFALAEDGSILYDSERNMSFNPASGHEWRIVGIGTRHVSRQLVTLDAASRGANIGQGWVHDVDHGTHRMWGMPKHHRATRVAPASADYSIPRTAERVY